MNSAEQREYLQEQNPDMLAMCFSLLSDDWGYTLKSNDSVLCCYPNQLTDWQIELPENFDKWNIVILDMWALRKKEIKIIGWNALSMNFLENPVLLSPWVIEYWEWENGKKYTQTVLRDGWKTTSDSGITSLADANQRTTTAWRNFSGDLFEDIEIENAEESPFLMINEQWEYVLVTNDLDYVSYLKHSIEGYLEKKYLSPADENYEEVKKAFERKFSWVGYDDLWNILQDIVENNRFEAYESEEWEIDWIKQTQIKLWENTWNFYVFHDEENNTVEYRSIRKITNFPEDLKSVWRLPLRIFLESSNQDPSLHKIENIWNYWVKSPNLVPTIEDFRKKIRKTVG
jgi:hypothetical protein